MSGCSGKNDPIRGGRFHCVVGKFADIPQLLPNGLVGLWRTNLAQIFNFGLKTLDLEVIDLVVLFDKQSYGKKR